MLELAAGIVVSAVAMSFFSDVMSRAMKLARAGRNRRNKVHVAHPDHSAA